MMSCFVRSGEKSVVPPGNVARNRRDANRLNRVREQLIYKFNKYKCELHECGRFTGLRGPETAADEQREKRRRKTGKIRARRVRSDFLERKKTKRTTGNARM